MLANWNEVKEAAWLPAVIMYGESERTRRSRARRIEDARLGRFKPMVDCDWKWPKKIDKTAFDGLFKLSFFEDGANSVLLGPNGLSKCHRRPPSDPDPPDPPLTGGPAVAAAAEHAIAAVERLAQGGLCTFGADRDSHSPVEGWRR